MDDSTTRFEKFIIKKIVDAVSYDPRKEEYHFNHIQITDEILKSIDSEGVRYGLKKDVIRTMVSKLASNIKTNPSIDEIHGSIEVGAIAPASHLEIVVRNEVKGRRNVELLSLGDNAFYVLSSNIAGIDYGINLLALDRVWANDYMIDFKVIKEGRLFPSKNHLLRLGKLEYVDFFIPSVIHEILDAETDYAVLHNETEQIDTVLSLKKKNGRFDNSINNEKGNNTFSYYYVWTPNRLSPITFTLEQTIKQDPLSTFIIYGLGNRLFLDVNKAFVFPEDSSQKKYLLDTLKECCVCKNHPYDSDEIHQIKTIRKGVLEHRINPDGISEWVLKEKPHIKYIYNE